MGHARNAAPALILRCVACLTAICMLAACSGGGHAGGGSAKARANQALRAARLHGLIGARRFVAVGGGGGPVGIIAIGGLPGGGKSGGPQISLPPIPPAGSSRPIAMPLDSYEQVAGNEQEVLVEASSLLTQRCMASRGFSYAEAAQPSIELSVLQQTENSPVGITGLSRAHTYGYAVPKGGPGGGPMFFGIVGAKVFGQAIQDNGPAWVTALLGFTPGPVQQARPSHEGCAQLVTTELYGPNGGSSNPDPVPGIAVEALQWTQSDPRILAVDKAWSSCMAARGYGYSTPQLAAQKNWPSTPTPVEIATAVADVTCKAQTNLTNTWLTVEAAYQLALIGQNLTALSQLQASFRGLLQRAETLVGAGGLPAGP